MREMVEGFNAAPPRREPQTVPVRTVWQRIKGEWPAFDPPRIPPSGLSLRWIWWHVLDDNPDPPSAEELAAAAAEEDRRYPECQMTIYRRQFPDWLARKAESAAEYASYQAWHELAAALDGRRGLPGERLGWLQTHEPAIRGLIEDAKAKHRRRWPEGSPGLRG